MAILTLKGHISRALNFYNNHESLYAAIGKSTKWAEGDCDELKTSYDASKDYDLDPPVPSINDDFLELIALKKIESAFMVVQDDEGTLEYRGTKWRIVSMFDENDQPTVKNVYKEGSRWVYLSTTLTYDEITTTLPYRQVGIFSNISKKSTVADGAVVLTPEDIEGAYVLEADFRRDVISEINNGSYDRLDTESHTETVTIEKQSDGTFTLNGVVLDLTVDPVMFMPVATLEILDNRKPVYRDTDVREIVKIILEF